MIARHSSIVYARLPKSIQSPAVKLRTGTRRSHRRGTLLHPQHLSLRTTLPRGGQWHRPPGVGVSRWTSSSAWWAPSQVVVNWLQICMVSLVHPLRFSDCGDDWRPVLRGSSEPLGTVETFRRATLLLAFQRAWSTPGGSPVFVMPPLRSRQLDSLATFENKVDAQL